MCISKYLKSLIKIVHFIRTFPKKQLVENNWHLREKALEYNRLKLMPTSQGILPISQNHFDWAASCFMQEALFCPLWAGFSTEPVTRNMSRVSLI